MSDREAMIFRPRILGWRLPGSTAPRRAKEEAAHARARKKGGVLDKIRRAHLVRRLARLNAARSAIRTSTAFAEGAGRGGFRIARLAKSGGTVGSIAAIGVVAAVAAVRLVTGKPAEGAAETVNRILIGDLDDEARAKMETRRQFSADPDLARIVGQEGRVSEQIIRVAKDIEAFRKREEIAKSLFREAFPADGFIGQLIVRAQQGLTNAWRENGGPDKLDTLATNYQALRDEKAAGR